MEGAARRMPLLRGIAPAPQAVQWDSVATYRVQLRRVANRSCGSTTCYEAVMLDAEPNGLVERIR